MWILVIWLLMPSFMFSNKLLSCYELSHGLFTLSKMSAFLSIMLLICPYCIVWHIEPLQLSIPILRMATFPNFLIPLSYHVYKIFLFYLGSLFTWWQDKFHTSVGRTTNHRREF